VATVVLLLDHTTVAAQSEFVRLEWLHWAAYCCDPVPATIEAVAGVTLMPVSVGPVMVSAALPVMLPATARMAVLPGATPLASPLPEMTATAGLLLDQVTVPVQSELVLFE
jgi:hypothetical protein